MPVSTIEFGPVNRRLVGAARVYVKAGWNDAWSLEPYLEVDEVVWSAAPSLPTASLTWHYGWLARPGSVDFERVLRLGDRHRWYVKIVMQLEFDDATNLWTEKTWYGLIDVQEDQIGGVQVTRDDQGNVVNTSNGEQKITAYGLERILQETFMASAKWTIDGQLNTIERGLTFNDRGLPNRYPVRLPLGYVFHGRRDDNNAQPAWWSTRKAVEYLVNWPTPPNPTFVLTAADANNLPDWDHPALPTDQVRVYDLIDQLIPRQRLLGWYLEVVTNNADPPVDIVYLRTFTYTPQAIPIGIAGATPIPANLDQYELVLEQDRTATVALKESTITSYDQVVLRGARRRSCFTISFDDSSLVKGWSAAQQTDYETGAALAANWPAAAEVKKRQERLAEYRSADPVRNVFRRYTVPGTWDGQAKGGITDPLDPLYLESGHPVFPQHQPLDPNAPAAIAARPPFPVYRLDMHLLPELPLLAGVDYSGTKIATRTVDESTARRNREELPMIVFWKLPNTDPQRWANVEELGRTAKIEKEADADNHYWSGAVFVVPGEPAFDLVVQGQPQHVLADGSFIALAEDTLAGPLGAHDWRDMLVTVCMPDDRFVQGQYPAAVPAARAQDAPRVLYLDAGEGYRQDYVAVGTIVAVDAAGDLVRSTGGYVKDDTPILSAGARVAYEWYNLTRHVLTITTQYLLDFHLGSMVLTLGDPNVPALQLAVNSPMTEFRLLIPRGTAESPPDAPMLSITTGAGELDPLRALGAGNQPLRADQMNKRPVPKL